MMHEFLTNNRDDLTARCRRKVALRPGRSATHDQLANGVPMLLDQLIRTLQLEQTDNRIDSTRISGPAGSVFGANQQPSITLLGRLSFWANGNLELDWPSHLIWASGAGRLFAVLHSTPRPDRGKARH